MKRIHKICLSFLLLLLPMLSMEAEAAEMTDSLKVNAEKLGNEMVALAHKFLGYPYVWAGNGPDAFDCTGFTCYLYRQYGYYLGRTAGAQALDGRQVSGDITEIQPGDVLIFGAKTYRNYFGHAAFAIGLTEDGEGIEFIHAASGTLGVIKSSTKQTYYWDRLVGVRRLMPDRAFSHVGDKAQVSYPFDASSPAEVEESSKLSLNEGEQAAVLFEGGSWAMMDASGALAAPDGTESIVMYPDGTWKVVKAEDFKVNAAKTTTSTTSSAKRPVAAAAQYHTVKSGDTLTKIAARYHTSVSKICSLNGIKSTATLKIGKRLRVK